MNTPTKRLYRSRTDRMLGGVAGGMAEYFGMDSSVMRIIFVVLILLPGISVIAYLIAWVVIPEQPRVAEGSEPITATTTAATAPVAASSESSRQFFAVILIGLGIFFLVRPFVNFHIWSQFWPAILILIGLIIIFGRNRK